MTGFVTFTGQALSLPADDVDTDIIFPARFLLITERKGLGRYAFADWIAAGDDRVGGGRTAPILIAGRNFGCGSSREQAVWAIADLGIKAIFAISFGEIFRANCTNNGVLAATVTADAASVLHGLATAGEELTADLDRQTVSGRSCGAIGFGIAPADRESLLNGWNATTRILALHREDVGRYEAGQRRAMPWLWTAEPPAEAIRS